MVSARLFIATGISIFAGGGQCFSAVSVGADDFLSSLGVNTHVDQGVSGSYYIEPLRYLGVRNIRDGGRNSLQTRLINRETGVRLDLLNNGGDLDFPIATGKALAASGALMAFEGPNEANNFPITYNGQTGGDAKSWAAVAQFQQALYAAVESDSDLRGYPVFAPSEAGGETDNVGLQYLIIPNGAGQPSPMEQNTPIMPTLTTMFPAPRMSCNNQAWNAADPTLDGPSDELCGVRNHLASSFPGLPKRCSTDATTRNYRDRLGTRCTIKRKK